MIAERRADVPPPQGPDAPRLLSAARRYEAAAVGELFEATFDSVNSILGGLLGQREPAVDAAADVYLRLLDRLGDRRARIADLGAWLAGAAYTEASRRRGRADGPDAAAGIGGRPYDARRVRAAFWGLPDLQREVLALRLLGRVSAEDAARMLDSSAAAVRGLEERALRSLDAMERSALDPTGLDGALDRVSMGEEPALAAGGRSELTPLLEVARALRSLAAPERDPAARSRVRSLLLAEAAERRAHWVHAHQGLPPARHVPDRRRFHPLRTLGLISALAAALVVGVLGAAMSGFAEPDSSLYGVKRAAENVLLAADAFDPTGRAELEVRLAQMRLREAEAMASAGKPDLVMQAIEDRIGLLRAAAQELISDRSRDSAWSAARARLLDEVAVDLAPLAQQLRAEGSKSAAANVAAANSAFANQWRALDAKLATPPSGPAKASQNPPSP